jgi:AraC-like DNA-binding protein
MDHVSLSTLDEHPSDRVACWGQICGSFFGNLGIDLPDDGPLDAELTAFEVGSLRMIRIDTTAHSVHRDSVHTELPTDDQYKLVFQLDGRGEIRQNERAFGLQPGDWSLYDPRVPYTFTNHGRTTLLVVLIPRRLLKGFRVPSLHTCEVQGGSVVGMSSMFGSFLRSMYEQLPSLPNGVSQPMSETVLGLLASTMAVYQENSDAHAPLPSVLMARVKQYVQTHLAEPDLTIERIALEMRCSKRYLHRVFEDTDCSLDRYIWQARLDRCHATLGSPAAVHKSISEIAFSWGFNSSAHFCRMFKNRFSLSPTEFRRLAMAAGTCVQPAPSH